MTYRYVPPGVELLLSDADLAEALEGARTQLGPPYVPDEHLRRLVAEDARRGVDAAYRRAGQEPPR